jgi:hypothetical protein
MVAAIEEIAKVASGNGRSVSELGETMSCQLATVDDIHHSAESVSQLAGQLETSLTIFQTGSVAPTQRTERARTPRVSTSRADRKNDHDEVEAMSKSEASETPVDSNSFRDGDRW